MYTSKVLILPAVLCILLQVFTTQGEAAAVDMAKEAATQLLTKAGETAAATPQVEQTGGVRQSMLHTGVDMVMEHGGKVLAAKYPAAAVALPIAKNLAVPVINKAHEKINNLFTAETTPATDDDSESNTTPKASGSTTEEAETGASTEAATTSASSEEASPSTESSSKSEGAASETTEKSATEKPGFMGKIKNFVKGDEKVDEKEKKDDGSKKQ